jgi:RHS repeat-associated protein
VFLGALSIVVTTLPIRSVIPALAAGYSSTILADSPTAYWRLGESSGTSAADATSHGNTGTYSGGFTLAQPGALFGDGDTAVKLDGTSGYVTVPNSAGLQSNQVSIELWIKKLTETPWGAYVTKNIAYGGNAGSSWFQLLNYGTTGRLQFRVTGDDGPSSLQSATTLGLNAWYHVVATYDGTIAKLYVNGSLDSSLSITATPTQTTAPLNIGRRPDGYYNNAVLDEVAIYSTALSATQVGSHWTASVNPPGAPTSVTVSIPASNQAKVTWVDPTSQGASAITGYSVTPHLGSAVRTPVIVAGATTTTTTLTGLSAGSYTFTVAANNANGSSVSSAASAAATVTGTTYGYSATVLGDNPAAYWRLGEASGTVAADTTGHGVTGTYFGTRTQNQSGGIFGDPDHAVSFDGSTAYMIAPSTSTLQANSVSIEVWLKKLTESASGTYVSKNFTAGGGAGTGWFELLNQNTTGHLQFRVTGDTADVSLTSNRVLALNTWYDVVATYDGTTAKLYVNGSLDSSMALVATPSITSDPIYIGRRSDGNYTNAVIDEVAIYPTVLTAAKVTTHWLAAGYVPGAPTGVSASLPHNTTNQASVSWTAPSSTGASAITGYTVMPQGGPVQRAPVTATASPVTITGLSGGSAYTFTVVATNSYGNGPASSPSAAKTPSGNAVPTVPTSVTATPGNTQAVVNWGVPTSNGGSAITSYTVTPYVGTVPGTPRTVTGSPPPTTATMTGLLNGTQYTFTVYASNAVGPGPAASTTATTPASVPGAPTGVSATAGNAQARVSWSAPSNGGSAITGYTVTPYVGGTAQTATGVSGSTTATTITNLANLTAYTFQVTATNAVGTSAAGLSGAAVTPTGPGPSVPGPPTSVAATATNGGALVTWQAPSNGGATITTYTVTPYVGTTAGTPITIPGSPPPTNTTLTGLTNGTTYVIYVAAANSQGTGPAGTSNPVTPADVPGMPTGVTAVAGNAQATVSWTAPASNGGTIQSYTVTPSIGSAITVSGGVTSALITGLTNGTQYTFAVSANNAAGSSPVGTSGVVTPATVPDPPGAITATSGNATANLTWNTAAPNGSTITTYTVTPYVGSTAGTPTPVTAPANGTTIAGLINGTTYTFQVTATNAVGTGQAGISNAVTVGTPTPPTSVSASSSAGNQATVTWTAAGGPSPTGYLVTAYLGLQAENSVATGLTTSVTITGFASGTYTFQVTALNASGIGLASAASASVVVAGAASTYASTVQADGPSVYYRFSETSGTVMADSSGNARPGGVYGSYTLGAVGSLPNDTDGAINLTGGAVNQAVAGAGLPTGNAPRSMEAWFKTTSTGPIMWYGNGQTVQLFDLKVMSGNQLRLATYNNEKTFTTPYSIGNGMWHYAVVTYDSTTLILYLDGQVLGTTTFGGALSTIPDANGLLLGNDYWNPSVLQATLDEVAVYPKALTASQVAAHFAASGNSRPSAPSAVTASSSTANQASVSWTASSGTVTSYIVTAISAGKAANAVAVGGTLTSAALSGLAGGSYTFQVQAFNNFGASSVGTSGSVTVSGASTYASTVQADGPSVYYRFSETAGTMVADSSGNARPGVAYGSYALGATGALPNDTDGAINLTGGAVTQSLAGAGLPTGNAPRSMEAWFKTTSTGPIMWYGNGQTVQLFDLKVVSGNQLQLVTYNNDKTFTTPYGITGGTWHYAVVTYDSTTLTLYLDGQTLGTATFGGVLSTVPDANGLLLGNDYWNVLQATLDEVAVYPKALTASQVAAHFAASGNSRPSAPASVSATSSGTNQATVSWVAASGLPTSYVVTSFNNNIRQNTIGLGGAATSVTLTGLNGGSPYTFQVQAFNNFGAGPISGLSGQVIPAGGSTYASTVLADGPAAYYRLDDAGGSVAGETSGNSSNGTYAGGYTLGQSGALPSDVDSATRFDGGSGYVYVPSSSALQNTKQVTIELWLKKVTDTQFGMYVTKNFAGCGGAGSGWYQLMNNGGHIEFRVTGDCGTSMDSSAVLAVNTWYYLVATYDGKTAKLYINGSLDSSYSITATPAITNDPLYIGRRSDGYYNNAVIDDVAIYPVALTDTQIGAHYTASGNAALPASPGGIAATGGTGQATVSWNTPSGNGGTITGYTVTPYVGTTAGTPVQVPVSANSTPVTGLTDGTTYTFQVTATSNIGTGQPGTSNAVTVGAPGAPTGITAAGGNAQAAVSWTAPASNASGITSYTVTPFVGATAGTPTTVTGAPPATSTTVTGLVNGTTYTFQVTATNTQGTSLPGTSGVATLGLPSAPGGVIATIPMVNNQAQVSWTAATANGLSITGYLVTGYNGVQAVGAMALGSTATAATITGLKGGTGYTFKVVATTSAGNGPAGTSALVTPTGPTSTYASTIAADGPAVYYRLGDPSGNSAADSSGNGSNGVYNGSYALGGTSALTNDADTSLSLTNGNVQLAGGTGLPSGGSPRTIEAWIKTTNTNYQVVAGYGTANNVHHYFEVRVSGSNIQIVTSSDDPVITGPYSLADGNWHHLVVTYDGNTTATVYVDGRIAGTAQFSGALITTADANGLMVGQDSWCNCSDQFVGNLDEVAIYPYALSTAQVSTHATASGTVPPSPPTAPTAVTAVAGANQASLSWTAPAGTITKYLVTAYQGSQAQNSIGLNGTTTSVIVSGLQAGLPYTFNVLAYNAYGASPPGTSSPVTPTGTNPMYAPTVLADTPLEYYRLDDPSGTIGADSSGNSRSATYAGTYTQASTGALPNDPDKALYVNSATVTASDTALPMANGARTIEAWVNTTGAGVQAIAGYGTTATRSLFDLRLNGSNQVGVVTWGDDKYFTAPYSLTNGQWHQIAATYDGTTVVVYVDGQSIGQSTFSSGLGTQSNGLGFVVGRDSWACCESFVGTLDDVSAYGSALSSSRVLAHFSASGNARPAAPTSVAATAGPSQATVSWTVPSGTIGWNLVTATQGTRKNQQAVAGGATNSTVISGLTPGLSYTFAVTATNNFGSGPASASSAAIVPTGSGTPYAGTVLADSPLEYYRLGDSGGTVAGDSSGNSQLGTYSGSYTQGVTGGLTNDGDKAVTLSNNTGLVTALDGSLPMGNSARTIEAWVNTTVSGVQGVAGYGTNAARGLFALRLNGSNQVGVVGGSDDHYFNVPYSVTNGQWHQMVATYDGTTLIMYVDGQQVGQTTTFAGALGTQSNGSGLVIGRDSWCVCDSFNGTMDDVSVYGSALSPARVLAHFTASGNARPAAPTSVTAIAGANQAIVSWTAPVGSVTGYQVTAILGNVAENSMMVGAVTTATVSGLNVGSAYTFQVQALNNFGSGPAGTSPLTTITAGSNPAYAATVLADGPVAYYRLDDSSGTAAADSSGGGQTGGYSGTYTLAQAGGLLNDGDKAVALSNSNGLVTAPDAFMPTGNNARTIEAWVKTTSTSTQGVAGYGANSTRALFDLRLSATNQVGVVSGSDDHYFTAGYSITNGVWHQVAATYDGTTLIVYVDGQSIGQTTFAGSLGTQSNGSGLVIGRDSWASADWLTGNVDDVSVYAKTLTSSQIANHWAAAGYRRPSAPINPVASAGPQGAIVSWTVPSDLGNPPLTGYTITPYAGSTAGTPVSVGPNLTNVTMSGLSAQTSYSFQVKANSVYDPPVANAAAITTALALVPVPANSAYVLEVGYADVYPPHPFQNFTPSPWQGSPNTTFMGTTGSIDSGALRIHDLTGSGITLNDIQVDIGATHFANIWGTNLAVPAGGDLILTAMTGAQGDFDTSDTPAGNCVANGIIPVIHVTINGVDIDWKDSGQVLNTGGIDTGSGGCGIGEGHDWSIIHNGPLPSEIMGPNGSMKICWTCMGLPVNTASGDFWHSFTDFDIPGRGFNLHFDRTYNSQMGPYDGPLGYGWSDPYNMFLSYDTSSGTILVHQEAGSSVIFTPNGSTYTPSTGVLASLIRNADGTFTFQRADLAKYVFNARGELLSETDRNGYATTFSYTTDQLTTVTEPAGRTLTLSYTGTHITRINDTAGSRNVTFVYDAVGNLTKATDVGGASTTFTYDQSHLMLTMTDPNGGTVTNVYDTSGRVTRQTDAMNRVTQFAYTPGQTTITDPNGNQTQDIYENGELIQETRAFGTLQAAKWLYSYDQVSLGVATVKDPNGNVMTSNWDANGNLLSTSNALPATTSYTYNAFNKVLTSTDPLGVTTTNSYDTSGNLMKTSTPLVGTTQYSITAFGYDPARPGDLTQKIDANGKVWQYFYDAYGVRNKTIDPLGGTTTYSYDNVGRLQSMVSPKGNVPGGNPTAYTTTDTFNAYGDRLSETDPLGHVTSFKYDGNRNRTVVIDGDLHQTTTVYDADGEPVQVVRSDGSTFRTVYDGDGNPTQQIDGLGNATTYQYDALNQRTKMTDPLIRSTQYTYDGAGNQLTVQNPKDSSVSYTLAYDVANQLKTITYSDGVTPNVSVQYDPDGQRTQMGDGTGTTTYTYDSLHRLTETTNGAGAQVAYGYDLQGNVTKLLYPGGTDIVTRTYDDAGRTASVTDWLNNTTRFGYDVNGNLTTQTYPNGVAATFTYDATNRLMQRVDIGNGSQLLNLAYDRDASNLLTAENAIAYGYDLNNRVTAATGSATVTYNYDAGDNLARQISGSNTTTNVYDAANQLQTATTMNGPTQVQKYTYGYNLNGDRITRTDKNNVVVNYGWDQANRLTSYGATSTYVYNGDGLRMSKTVSGTPEPFVFDVVQGLPAIIRDGNTRYVTGPGGLAIEQVSGTTTTYYHQDQLGSSRVLTGPTGASAAAYSYDAYGNLTSTPPAFANPFQFAGQYFDSESGLVYMRARYYDPGASEFVSRDPATSDTRLPYAYAADNPANKTDPSGLYDCGWEFWKCVRVPTSVNQAQDQFRSNVQDAAVIALRPWVQTDFVTVGVGFGPVLGGQGSITFSKSGHIFVSPGVNVGTPGLSGFLAAGHVNTKCRATGAETDSFIGGTVFSAGAYAGVGGTVTYSPRAMPGATTGYETGFGTPQAQASVSQGFQLPWIRGPSW